MITLRKMLTGTGVLFCLIWVGMTVFGARLGAGNWEDVASMIGFIFLILMVGWPLGHLIDRMTETKNGN